MANSDCYVIRLSYYGRGRRTETNYSLQVDIAIMIVAAAYPRRSCTALTVQGVSSQLAKQVGGEGKQCPEARTES